VFGFNCELKQAATACVVWMVFLFAASASVCIMQAAAAWEASGGSFFTVNLVLYCRGVLAIQAACNTGRQDECGQYARYACDVFC
jgi:hypothetical protein